MIKIITAFILTATVFSTNISVYTISIPAANGDSIHLSDYAGKKVMIVNVCLNSKYTYQLLGLQQLYQSYQDSLVIIAIPSNSFGNESAPDSVISFQLQNLFNIGFPIASKADVNGIAMSPLYSWLTQESENGSLDNFVQDDFTKYLIDGSGHLIGIFRSQVEPMSTDIQSAITGVD